MYPREVATAVSVASLGSNWEGASRPTHFDGMATVVAKLFNVIGPCRSYFGEKDYQQLQIIRRFVADLDRAGKLVAAICHGGWMLCCTDVLKGKKATSFMAIKHDMINAGAHWIDAECVIDGNVITARKPDDLPAFCRAILELLGG